MAKENLTVGLLTLIGGFFLLSKSSQAATDKEGRKFTPPFVSPTDFIKLYYPLAQQYSACGSIPPVFTIAQAGIESGWGTSDLFSYHNNVFGIKAGKGWSGNSYQGFRSYDSIPDSFADHAKLLSTSPIYAAAFDPLNVPDAITFAQVIAPIYTPDPGYFDLLKAAMNKIQPLLS